MYLELQDIKKSYGSGDTRTLVLKGISLSLEKGTICVLLGPSGSGKSTLLNIIGGIDSADSGTITIDGQSVGKMNEKQLTSYRRRNLGYIFQSYNLIPNLTVRENIEVGAYLGDSPLDLDELISVLGLENHQDKLPSQLSGGQQQRTALQLYYAETGPQDPDDELQWLDHSLHSALGLRGCHGPWGRQLWRCPHPGNAADQPDPPCGGPEGYGMTVRTIKYLVIFTKKDTAHWQAHPP